jgi:hypothetical protein
MHGGRTETIVRVYDAAGRLLSETITMVTERVIIDPPPGFRPVPALDQDEPAGP